MRKVFCVFGLLMCLCHAPAFSAQTVKIDMAAAPPGAAWYVAFGAYAKVITTLYPEMDTTLFPGGGIANVIRVAQGQSQIGLTATPFMRAAVEGSEPYTKAYNVKALGNLNDICPMFVCVPENSKLTSVQQIVEQKLPARISVGSKVGGNGEMFTRWMLNEYGLTKNDLLKNGGKYYGLTTPETVSMLQENQLDLDVYTGPGKPHRYQEVLRDKKLRFLELSPQVIKSMGEKYGFVPQSIPAGFFEGIDKDVQTISVPTAIVINADLSDDIAYKLARALVEGANDIALAVPAWNTIKPDNVCKGLPIELHPGAAKYYREIGCLK